MGLKGAKFFYATVVLVLAGASQGCMQAYVRSVGADLDPQERRIFIAPFDVTWQAVLDSLKSFNLEVSNRESGFVQTKWTDNSNETRLADPYGAGDTLLKTVFRYRIQLVKGVNNGKPSVRLSVSKDQLVQSDVLEGWRPVVSEPLEENTLLYRIERLIFLRQEFARLESEKADREIAPELSNDVVPE